MRKKIIPNTYSTASPAKLGLLSKKQFRLRNWVYQLCALALILLMAISCVGLLTPKPVNAQSATPTLEWSKTYSPNTGLSIAQTSDGGYIIAGINRYGYHDSLSYSTTVIKTDDLGNIEWEKQFGSNFTLLFPLVQISIIQTNDSGYILSTPSSNTINELIKLDSKGNIEWQTQVSGGKVIEANDGYFISGFSMDSFGNSFSNITKVDFNGHFVWEKNFDEGFFVNGNHGNVAFRALSPTIDSKYAFAGNWGSSFWFGIMDKDGDLLVNKTYPQDGYSDGFSGISNTIDGGFILCGYGSANAVLYKVDGQGNLGWNNSYTQSGAFTSVVQTSNNEYLVGTSFGFIVNLNSNGSQRDVANYSSSVYSIASTSDGGFAVTGSLNDELWLAKFSLESISSATPTLSPSPSVPELSWLVIVPLLLSVFSFAVVIRQRKTTATWRWQS